MDFVRSINHIIEQTKPWENPANKESEIRGLMLFSVNTLLKVAIYLKPFMPETAKIIEQALRANKIVKATPLFPRLT